MNGWHWVLFLVGAALSAQNSAAQLTIKGYGDDGRPPAAAEGAPAAILFTTFGGIAGQSTTVSSQNFTDPGFPDFLTYAADDFTVPGGAVRWVLETVEVDGAYFDASNPDPGPADSVNVYILFNNAAVNLPDTTDFTNPGLFAYHAENLPFTDRQTGDFTVDLPERVRLPPGDYWLVVQANMPALDRGQWGWRESSAGPDTGAIVGFESAWLQTQNIIGNTCIDQWGRRISDCNNTDPGLPAQPEFDLAFVLRGDDADPAVDVSAPGTLTVSESGGEDAFSLNLAARPLDDVVIELTTSDATEGLLSTTADMPMETVSLTFTPSDWDMPQTVTVAGQDDNARDGDVPFSVQFTAVASNDPDYAALTPADIAAVNIDDNCPVERLTTTGPNAIGSPSITPNGNRIAFHASDDLTGGNADGNSEIFLYDGATDSFTQVTDTVGGESFNPSISADGSRVAFQTTTSLADGAGVLPEIVVFDVGAGVAARLANHAAATVGSRNPVLSADGARVAFVSDGDYGGGNPDGSDEVFRLNIASTTVIQLSDDPGDDPAAHGLSPSISADGARVAFVKLVSPASLYLWDEAGGTAALISADGVDRAALDGSGEHMAFIADGDPVGQNADGGQEAFLATAPGAPDGAGVVQLTDTVGAVFSEVAITADGQRVGLIATADLAGENADGGLELFTLSLPTNNFRQLTAGPAGFQLFGASLSGDGLRAALASNLDAPSELYLSGPPQSLFDAIAQWPSLTVLDLIGQRCE